MGIKWDDPETKNSHEKKPLAKHLEEVRELFQNFVNFYSLQDSRSVKLVKKVLEYHDHGKLHPKWTIERIKQGEHIPHSDKSATYYWENVMKGKPNPEDALILLLILKFHSPLTTRTRFRNFDSLMQYLQRTWADYYKREWGYNSWWEWFCNNFPFNERIELVDLYGLLKVCDCLSASSRIGFQIKSCSHLSIENLRRNLSEPERMREQEKVGEMGSFAILRAPTGWGKTMASPLYSFAKNPKRSFLILPTITAINKLYERFRNWFGNDVGEYFYFYDAEESLHSESYELSEYEYFLNRYFLRPVMISTLDQVLLSFLQVGAYPPRRCMFRESVLIIDEIHLLNERMLCLLLHFLKKFWPVYRFNVLLMSATISKSRCEVIKKELGLEGTDLRTLLYDVYDANPKYKSLSRVRPELCLNKTLEQLSPEMIKRVEEGKRVLVCCNTVECAVHLNKELESQLDKKESTLLLHARLMYSERRERERKIEKLSNPHILITTQVCEVSLDISYNYLFTELAPLPSLIQRFGRVNRDLKKVAQNTNVVIAYPLNQDDKFYPYTSDSLGKAERCLKEIGVLEREFQLLQKLEEIESSEDLESDLDRAKRELRIGTAFEGPTGYFYSLDLDDAEVQKILSYRDSFTTMVIPFGDVISGRDANRVKNELDDIWKNFEEAKKRRDRKNILRVLKEMKKYCVNVPVHWLKGAEFKSQSPFPVVEKMRPAYTYDTSYGFIRSRA